MGAGIAGLTAAYQLNRTGHEVTILETQSRVGGRAVTLRSFFPSDLVAQAGPSRFHGDFRRVFEYARSLGLELVPYYPDSGSVVALFKGRRIEEYNPSPEEFWGYTAIVNRYPGGLEGIALRLALWVRASARRVMRKPTWMTYGIRGGTDLLTEALARATKADIRLETTVRTVTQNGKGVRIGFVNSHGDETLEADYAVCAVPLSIARSLDFLPAVSREKTGLMNDVPFASAIRVFLQMKRAFWRDRGHNGFAVTDSVGEVWDPHFDAPGEPALLVCYAKDDLARRLGAMNETERLDYALQELEKIFPGAQDHFVKGVSFYWDEQPWIRGGWPLVREGYANKVGVFREPEGRVYFAGDYAASPSLLNTMEGAIESGEFAASQINQRQ
jgi:monoamine oxidase